VNVDNAEAAEVPVLRLEWSVGDRDVLDEFWAERFERSEVALSVALRALVLLHVVNQNFESAVDAAVVEVEPEAADLQGLPAALVLAGVDPRIELLECLVVPREEGAVENCSVAPVDLGFERFGCDDDALMLRCYL